MAEVKWKKFCSKCIKPLRENAPECPICGGHQFFKGKYQPENDPGRLTYSLSSLFQVVTIIAVSIGFGKWAWSGGIFKFEQLIWYLLAFTAMGFLGGYYSAQAHETHDVNRAFIRGFVFAILFGFSAFIAFFVSCFAKLSGGIT